MATISPDKVSEQLERIVAHSKFSSGNRLAQFLRYVVKQVLNGRSDDIKQYTIAVEALGYETDFNPQSNPAVRILARRLRRALEQYYQSQGVDDPIRIDIPKGSYVPIFSINQTATKPPDPIECKPSAQSPTPPVEFEPSIAVMTLTCLSAVDECVYLSTGLTEEILIALTKFPNFFVVGPLSENYLHRKGLEKRDIGQEYGVRFLLEGSIRTFGKKYQIAVRLIDAFNGQNLWGKVLDISIETTSIADFDFNITDQVVATIADSYGVIPRTLTKESKDKPNESISDYEAVLRFYHHFRVLTEQSQIDAINALERTVRRDPDYALAAAMLGDLIASTYHLGYEDSNSVLKRAEELGRKAVGLDSRCQPARYTMALIYFLHFRQKQVLKEAEQCIQLNPNNANYLAGTSLLLAMVGKWDRSFKLMKKAMNLNPHHPGWYHLVPFMNLYHQGEYELALNEAQHFNTPDYFWDPLIRATVLGQLDRQIEAEQAIDELLTLVPDFNRRGLSLIRRFVFSDENTNLLLDGLHKAGLKLHSN